jgi:hypothetical protein
MHRRHEAPIVVLMVESDPTPPIPCTKLTTFAACCDANRMDIGIPPLHTSLNRSPQTPDRLRPFFLLRESSIATAREIVKCMPQPWHPSRDMSHYWDVALCANLSVYEREIARA